MRVTATAYCDHGVTESGAQTRRGTIAADPRVLPLGSVVRMTSPLRGYSGTYTVTDTGSKVKGRTVDIFVPNCARARAFGTRVVVVTVLRRASASPKVRARQLLFDTRCGPRARSGVRRPSLAPIASARGVVYGWSASYFDRWKGTLVTTMFFLKRSAPLISSDV